MAPRADIVNLGNAMATALRIGSPYKLQQLSDMYRTAADKEEFVGVLCTRLLMMSQRPQ